MFIQDNYCPDQKTLDFLKKREEWEKMIGKFHWWDGWKKQKPKNYWEYIIQMIWQTQAISNDIAGFEYWCNILDSNTPVNHLDWHRDKDEKLAETQKKYAHPVAGTVFYGYPHEFTGGFLEIKSSEDSEGVERIKAVYNRIIIFDASQFHRVTEVTSGSRFGMQINLWKSKPLTFEDGDVT